MTQAGRNNKGLKLGLNGLGRIGKLTLWRHAAQKNFSEIVVNLGRTVGAPPWKTWPTTLSAIPPTAPCTAFCTATKPGRWWRS